MSLLEWAKRHKEKCPDCSQETPRTSLIKLTAWCPNCHRIWRLRGDNSGKVYHYWWYYLTDEGKPIKRIYRRSRNPR